MQVDPYRRVLALPGVRSLILVALVARVPFTASGIALTLHVVLGLHRGYGAAGLVGAGFTIGAALGSPMLGRLVDRRGLRPMLVLTVTAEALFWAVAPVLPYAALLGAAVFAGLLSIPVFGTVRQSLAALVPEDQRKTAYSIDSMSVELSYMAGPALAVVLVTALSTTVAAWLVGAAIVLAGLGMIALNPPIRAEHEEVGTGEPHPKRRSWLRPRLAFVLLATVASTLILGGADVSVVAVLREAGQLGFTSVVLPLWGAYSMAGGFVYGTLRRSPRPLVLVGLLGLATIPVGLAGDWRLLALALIPGGVLCAPSLAATADAVSRLVPAAVRGEAMGLHGSALTVGMALGAPLAGAVVDAFGPPWAFAVVGLVGAGLATAGLVASRIRPPEVAPERAGLVEPVELGGRR
ncbi:MAG TPA: MFS transporter [Micromonosporaceae bacterium]|jgi:MFS family permease|nr:MFS transporter [Micromonosporaceae bacterium]